MKKVFLMIVIALMTCNLFAQSETNKGGTNLTILGGKTTETVTLNACGGKGELRVVDSKGVVLYQANVYGDTTINIPASGYYTITLSNGSCFSSQMVQL